MKDFLKILLFLALIVFGIPLVIGGILLVTTFSSTFILYTSPICFLLGISFLGWYLAGKEWRFSGSQITPLLVNAPAAAPVKRGQSPLRKATRSMLGSVTLGLAALALMMYILNFFKATIEPEWVRAVEEFFIGARLRLGKFAGLEIITFVAQPTLNKLANFILVVAILISITYFAPKLQLVTRFFRVKKIVSGAVIALCVLTSFTFFSQIPTTVWASDAHTRNIESYRVLLRQEWNSTAKHLAAQALQQSARELGENQRHFYRTVGATVAQTYSGRTSEEITALYENLADTHSKKNVIDATPTQPTEEERAKLPEEVVMEREARTVAEWEKQKNVLARQKERAKVAEIRAIESTTALRKIFAEVITSGVPGLPGDFNDLTEKYVKKLVSGYSEAYFDKAVERWFRRQRRPVEPIAAATRSTPPEASVMPAEMVAAVSPPPEVVKQLLIPPDLAGTTTPKKSSSKAKAQADISLAASALAVAEVNRAWGSVLQTRTPTDSYSDSSSSSYDSYTETSGRKTSSSTTPTRARSRARGR